MDTTEVGDVRPHVGLVDSIGLPKSPAADTLCNANVATAKNVRAALVSLIIVVVLESANTQDGSMLPLLWNFLLLAF